MMAHDSTGLFIHFLLLFFSTSHIRALFLLMLVLSCVCFVSGVRDGYDMDGSRLRVEISRGRRDQGFGGMGGGGGGGGYGGGGGGGFGMRGGMGMRGGGGGGGGFRGGGKTRDAIW